MRVKRLRTTAVLPEKAHAGDLGYDLFAAEDTVVFRGETRLISTGIAIEFPPGYGGFIKDRSSVATKKHLFTVAGVIDNGYTGEIRIAVFNASDGVVKVAAGEKIAQLVLVPTVDFEVVETDELTSSDGRETGGFGSTGA
jgi:dUTP pyrophosphatase